MSLSTSVIALQDCFGQGLLQKIPRHLFSSGSAEQLHVAANVGVKAAICQQKPWRSRTHFSGQRVLSLRNVTLLRGEIW